jgi:DNA-directed RNA polymerase specialized sigma24 family protein
VPLGARGSRRGLEPETFDRLLAALDPLRERAGEKYEAMRGRLLRFFLSRGVTAPEELADETIDRVGRKLAEGEQIRVPDIGRYFLGVARNVARESWDLDRRRRESQAAVAVALRSVAAAPGPSDDAVLGCLERCLASLPPESRDLVLRYYDYEAPQRIERRRALAERLGVEPNALHIRLYRLRHRLEACIQGCLGARNESAAPGGPLHGGGEDA